MQGKGDEVVPGYDRGLRVPDPNWPAHQRVGRFVPKQLALFRTLYDDGQTDIAPIYRTLGISRATLYRALHARPDHD
jgi:hypothetical protein